MKRFSIFQKHKATGNMTWYGRISEDGLFHVVSLGTKKKADAVAWLDLMNAKKFLPEAFANEKPDANLVELSHKFIDSCDTANNASFATIKAYQLRISYFLEWAKEHGKSQVSQVTDKDAVDFSTLIATRYAPKTAGEIIKLTKAMFSFSHKIFKTESNPFEYVRRPRIKKVYKKLLDARRNQRNFGSGTVRRISQVLGAYGVCRPQVFRSPRSSLERRQGRQNYANR